jgi:hypothetical protein
MQGCHGVARGGQFHLALVLKLFKFDELACVIIVSATDPKI